MKRFIQWAGAAMLPLALATAGGADCEPVHVDRLSGAGPVTVSTVEDGAHLLAHVAPGCFVSAVSAFVNHAPVPEDCVEQTP